MRFSEINVMSIVSQGFDDKNKVLLLQIVK